VLLVDHDDMIQTFSPDRTNQPLDVAVPEEIARRGVLGKGLHDLLGGPLVEAVAEKKFPRADPRRTVS